MIKKLTFLLFVTIQMMIFAQTGYVDYSDPVYKFLERLASINIIENYNSFELPKTSSSVADYLLEAENNKSRLNPTDLQTLEYYLSVFEYDIKGTTDNYSVLFPKFSLYNHLINDKNKSLYNFSDNDFSFFLNFEAENHNVSEFGVSSDINRHLSVVYFGGSVRGSFLDHFHYYLRARNGTYTGSRTLAERESNLKYNYKFNESYTSTDSDYFDDSEGYLMADYDIFRIKIGNDRMILGYPESQSILGINAPPVDYILMNINYKFFKFSYLHGKLLGNVYEYLDYQTGSHREINEKYLVYHRFEFNFSKHFTLGLGETIIYSNRGMDLSYFNPFTFYKSVEHVNQDRDNSKMFIDFINNSIDGLRIYGSLQIDDLDFSRIGTNWVGNTVLYNIGMKNYMLQEYIPLTFNINYLRIDPYFYTHRLPDNNYTSLGLPLGPVYQPNSSVIEINTEYFYNHKLSVELGFVYYVHGANEYSESGKIIKNHGGDLDYGYFSGRDSGDAVFLDGLREYSRIGKFSLNYEAAPGYNLQWIVKYYNESRGYGSSEKTESGLNIKLKI